jgi:predicted P-loop ATPase
MHPAAIFLRVSVNVIDEDWKQRARNAWDDPSWRQAAIDRQSERRSAADVVTAAVKKGKAQRYTAALAQGFVDVTVAGDIKATCANTCNAIVKLGIACRYDQFRDRLEIGGQPIAEFAGELSDNACLYLRKIIEEEFGFDPGREKALDTAVQLCLDNQFDPVVGYLDGLKWDGTPRIERWLIDYAGAEDTPFNRAVSGISMIAQVRRARHPGCKFDQIIVLEGKEGTEKSSLLERLAGGVDFFSDQTILGLSDRDQQERLRGVWVYEIADLTNVTKAEVEHVKAFASRTHDRARPAYGRTLVSLARRGVIWATTNNPQYLRSQTGNRRFWPVRTGVIKLAEFVRDRDQLFAEAAAQEAAGASIVLPEELWPDAAEQQEQRREYDPWEDVLANVKGAVVINESGQPEERALTGDILWNDLCIPKDRQTEAQAKRVAAAMRLNGWSGPTVMRVSGNRGRGFSRPVAPAAGAGAA